MLKQLREKWNGSSLAHMLDSIRRNPNHFHRWEWDDVEYATFKHRSRAAARYGRCWTCCHCLATVNPKKRRPRRWSLFHRWN